MKEKDVISKPLNANSFPVDVLPDKLRKIINEAHATLGFPKDYLAGSMLTAMTAAVGNTHAVEHMDGWKEYVILFVALVGSPGSNKSHPLSFAMQPLIDFDAEQAALHTEALKRYNAAMELPPKERATNGYDLNPAEPIRKRFTMQDVTPKPSTAFSRRIRAACASFPMSLPGGSRISTDTTTVRNRSSGCRCSTTR